MKKLFLLFLMHSFNIINCSDNSNELSSSPEAKKPLMEFCCRVYIKPIDPDEICPSPTEIASFDNFIKTIEEFVNGKNENEVTISSFNSDCKKMVRITTIRHDNTPIVVTYLVKNIYNNPLFKESSIWRAERAPIANKIEEILDYSDETVFSNNNIDKIEEILNAKVTDCFPPEETSQASNLTITLLEQESMRRQRDSKSYRDPISDTPALTENWSQPYYPKEFINQASPEPTNPNFAKR